MSNPAKCIKNNISVMAETPDTKKNTQCLAMKTFSET